MKCFFIDRSCFEDGARVDKNMFSVCEVYLYGPCRSHSKVTLKDGVLRSLAISETREHSRTLYQSVLLANVQVVTSDSIVSPKHVAVFASCECARSNEL